LLYLLSYAGLCLIQVAHFRSSWIQIQRFFQKKL